jgi:hypothetical protein
MFLREMQVGRFRMRLLFGIVVLAAALGAVKLWAVGAMTNWVLTGFMVGTGLGVILFAWFLGIWLRKRQRRRSMDMRDSALW